MRTNFGRFWADDPPALVASTRAALRVRLPLSSKERSVQRRLYAYQKHSTDNPKTATLLSLSRCTKVQFAQKLTGSQTLALDR
jgi:hypothetical protein